MTEGIKTRCIYVIAPHEGPLKIGIAVSVPRRLTTLQMASPVRLTVRYSVSFPYDEATALERAVHEALSADRLSGEWFSTDVAAAVAAIEAQQKRLGFAPSGMPDAAHKGPGRPRVGSTCVGVRFPPAELETLDRFIEKQHESVTRPEAIRRIVRKAVKA